MLFTRSAQTVVVFISILILLVIVFRVAGSIGLHEAIVGLRQKQTISHQIRQEMADFEELELHFRRAKEFDEWWQAVCVAVDKMDFVRSSLPTTDRDGTKRSWVWEKDNGNIPTNDIVRLSLPIRDRRANSSLNIEIQVHANGSLESAGRRAALFARLMEEHGIVALPTHEAESSFAAIRHMSDE